MTGNQAFTPTAWLPPRATPFEENTRLRGADLWQTGGAGPEDVAIAADGSVFTGLDDGRIVRFHPDGGSPGLVADTGGRPLGIEIGRAGDLIVCDATRGLLRVTTGGSITVLADSYEDEPFLFTNNAAVADDGTVYFTVTSTRYPIGEYVTDLLEHSGTGRLFALHPGGDLVCLRTGLQFANGVALGRNEVALFVAETGAYRVNRLWLTGERAGTWETFADNLPGFPDNLSFDGETLWVPLASPRQRLVDLIAPRPGVRKLVHRLPERLKPAPLRHGWVLGYSEAGSRTHDLQDATGRVAITTGARRFGDRLYIGSLSEPTVAVVAIS